MIATFRTLITGANLRAETRLRDTYALELIDQKIRETEDQLRAAKLTLASLIQRRRSEARLLDTLAHRVAAMLERAQQALNSDRPGMANEAASAIAEMENEMTIRQATVERLDTQVTRLQASVERSHRRIVDLKQGAITAKAIRREQQVQGRLNSTLGGTSAADEAQELINRVVSRDDPLEQSQILEQINAGLDHSGLEDRMADAGFGPATKVTASSVLARLQAAPQKA